MRLVFEKGTGGVTRIDIDGRLDMDGVREVEDTFAFAVTAKQARIVVNLAGVSFLSSIGIRMLMTAARGQQQRGGKIVFAAPGPMVRRVLETAGIDRLVPLHDSVEEATAAISHTAGH